MASPNTRVVFDIARDTNTVIDLTPYFQGRVGDSKAPLPLGFINYGRAYDLTGKDVVFYGKDHEGTPFVVYGSADDVDNGDSWHKGRVTMRFPAGVFQTQGVWSEAYFRIVDNKVDPEKLTAIISTLNVNLKVLDDGVNLSVIRHAYHSGLESIIDDFKKYVEEKTTVVDNLVSELSGKYPELIAKFQTLKALDNSIDEMIKSKQVATIADLGTNLVENNIGGLPTPAMYIEKGFYKIHYGYVYLADLDIVPGQTVDATECEQVALVQTTVLNNIVSQEATVQAKNDFVYKLERKSTGDTTWSKWHIVAEF